MENIQENRIINIDINEILNRIYSESAFIYVTNPETFRLSSDQNKLVITKLHEGFAALARRISGYTAAIDFSVTDLAIAVTLRSDPPAQSNLKTVVAENIKTDLTAYALMVFYHDHTPRYENTWHSARSQLTAAFAIMDN